jgi:hypothetical protein
MSKLDLTKHYKNYYTARTKPELTVIEKAQYLSLTGKGDPSAQLYSDKIQALYGVAYTIKFDHKARSQDFTVAKLEAQWWFDEQLYKNVSMQEAPQKVPRSEWQYRLLIRLPEFVSQEDITHAKDSFYKKKKMELVHEVGFYEMTEGKVIQMLHIGAFDQEPETLLQIQAFSDAHSLRKNGLHHEIYLSDFRKTAPEKLKTILREPVK